MFNSFNAYASLVWCGKINYITNKEHHMMSINYGLCDFKFCFLPNINIYLLEDENGDSVKALEFTWFHCYLEFSYYEGEKDE